MLQCSVEMSALCCVALRSGMVVSESWSSRLSGMLWSSSWHGSSHLTYTVYRHWRPRHCTTTGNWQLLLVQLLPVQL